MRTMIGACIPRADKYTTCVNCGTHVFNIPLYCAPKWNEWCTSTLAIPYGSRGNTQKNVCHFSIRKLKCWDNFFFLEATYTNTGRTTDSTRERLKAQSLAMCAMNRRVTWSQIHPHVTQAPLLHLHRPWANPELTHSCPHARSVLNVARTYHVVENY